MSQIAALRWAVALAIGLAASAACAADPPTPAKGAAGHKRLLYIVQHRPASDLAALLGPFFKGAAEFRTVPDSPVNALLISAAPSAFDDAVQAVQRLDRPPRTVSVDVWLAVVAPPKEGDKADAERPTLKEHDLVGPAAEVAARLDDLRDKGALSDVTRLRLTAVEGRPESTLVGAAKPFTTGVNALANGPVIRSITYRDQGSQVHATVSASPEDVVTVDLQFVDVRADAPDGGVPIGKDEKGKPVFATEFLQTRWDGKLTIPSGQTRIAFDAISGSGRSRLVVVVGATLLKPDK